MIYLFIREASDPLEISLVNTSSSTKKFFGENFMIFEKKIKNIMKMKKNIKVDDIDSCEDCQKRFDDKVELMNHGKSKH